MDFAWSHQSSLIASAVLLLPMVVREGALFVDCYWALAVGMSQPVVESRVPSSVDIGGVVAVLEVLEAALVVVLVGSGVDVVALRIAPQPGSPVLLLRYC